MAKRSYTDEDRAAVRLALEVNKGNVKASSRDTGVPYMTVSNWKAQWAKEGTPPAVQEATIAVANDFVETGVRVRDYALRKIEELLPLATVKDLRSLSTLVGILDDKVRLAQGLATSRREDVVIHIDPEAIGAQIALAIGSTLDSARQRAELIEGTVIDESEDEPA